LTYSEGEKTVESEIVRKQKETALDDVDYQADEMRNTAEQKHDQKLPTSRPELVMRKRGIKERRARKGCCKPEGKGWQSWGGGIF